jgi:crossover junction endodeoxyribonuclease RusA
MNTLYPTSRSGHRFLSKKGKAYVLRIRALIGHNRMPPCRLAYTLVLCPPDKRKRDLSNHVKAIEDCLTKCGFWEDDSLVDDFRVTRGEIIKGGRALMTVWDTRHIPIPPL